MGRTIFLNAMLAGAAALLAVPAGADTKAGVDAWTRGEFAVAIKHWQVEAAKGDSDALFNLGQAYKLGKGVNQDLAKAEEFFAKASVQGHAQASDNYGLLLFQRGQRSQALPFIRAAADRGDPRGQYLLGIGHFNGDIVPRDWVMAYALVSLARQAGLEQAIPALTQMDVHIPLAQRQQAVSLSAELQSQADATRGRQLAAADLDASVLSGGGPAPTSVPRPPRAPTVASASSAAAAASSAANGASPRNAGADFTRPAPRPPVAAPAPVAPRPAVIAAPAAAVAAAAPAASVPAGTWRIQLGAFGVPGNADALWLKVRGRPELAGHPRLNTRAGAVTKLQAGGFAGEQDARNACARLVAGGFTCIAVRN